MSSPPTTESSGHLKRSLDNGGCEGDMDTSEKKPKPWDHDFMSWCSSNGILISEKVKLIKRDVGGIAMIATQDIEAGDELFQIPNSAVLSAQTTEIADLLQEPAVPAVNCNYTWSHLAVAIMYERSNPESKWKAYLNNFPNFDGQPLPMFWDREDLKKGLAHCGVIRKVQRDRYRMKRDYEEIVKPLVESNQDRLSSEHFTYENFLSAVAFIMAYSFDVPDQPSDEWLSDDDDSDDERPDAVLTAMVPVADALNHTANHNAEINGDHALDESDPYLLMEATQNIRCGEEVYNTYGVLPNNDLIQTHGFALDTKGTNNHECVNLPISELNHFFAHSGSGSGSPKEVEQRAEFIFKSLCYKELMHRKKGENWSRAVQCAGLSQGIEYNGVDGYTDVVAAVGILRALSFRDFRTLKAKNYSQFLSAGCAAVTDQIKSLSDQDITRLFDGATKYTMASLLTIRLKKLVATRASLESLPEPRRTYCQHVVEGRMRLFKEMLDSWLKDAHKDMMDDGPVQGFHSEDEQLYNDCEEDESSSEDEEV